MVIFLSTSFTSKTLPDGRVEPEFKKHIEAVISVLEGKGHAVLCGMREDGWRVNEHEPIKAFNYDVSGLMQADLVIVLLRNNPISAGIEFELGYAHALGKDMLVLQQADDKPVPFINQGLFQQSNVNVMTYVNIESVPEFLIEAL